MLTEAAASEHRDGRTVTVTVTLERRGATAHGGPPRRAAVTRRSGPRRPDHDSDSDRDIGPSGMP